MVLKLAVRLDDGTGHLPGGHGIVRDICRTSPLPVPRGTVAACALSRLDQPGKLEAQVRGEPVIAAGQVQGTEFFDTA